MTPFLLCSYFRAHPTTLLLEILGGADAWAVPHLKYFGGPSPQSPRSPPLSLNNYKPICKDIYNSLSEVLNVELTVINAY